MEAVRPRLRGVSHQVAFFLALPLGVALTLEADTFWGRVAAIVFGASVAAMFGASGFYHRVTWSSARRLWVRRVDHAGIFGLEFIWVAAPRWLAALIGIALGWVGVVVFPQLLVRIGVTAACLSSPVASPTRRAH